MTKDYSQGDVDVGQRKETEKGLSHEPFMLMGKTRAMDERGLDIEKTEHRVLDGERICNEKTANSRGARMDAF